MKWIARLLITSAVPVLALGCRPAEEADIVVPPRPVRTVTVGAATPASSLVFSGLVEARDAADLSFRIAGRLIERPVGVGTALQEGQVVARLGSEVEVTDLRSAQAAEVAAESASRKAAGRFDRQSQLYRRGTASRAEFESAQQAAKAAESQLEAARAQARTAAEVLGFTVLEADAPGIVTWVGAEPGEVVAAGRPVVRVARRDGRDAVFDVPAGALELFAPDNMIKVSVPSDPSVTAKGRVREVSPEADPVTRQFRVRVGLTDPPASLRLGMVVQGTVSATGSGGTRLPSSAATRKGAGMAVWVVDPASGIVNQRPVEIAAEDPGTITVSKGLSLGDIVVTAGVSSLKPGQKVRLAEVGP